MASLRNLGFAVLAGAVLLSAHLFAAQGSQAGTPSNQKQQQDIPDAPSASRPPQPGPPTLPPARPPSAAPASSTEEQPNAAPPRSGEEPATPPEEPPQPRPEFKVDTVPEGSVAPPPNPGASEELYKLVVVTNQVMVPVRVADDSGRLVNGLLPKDFAVYENGKKEPLNFFTSDPFALSAAIVLDLGMPDVSVQKVNRTFSALSGAFSQYDEVAVYTYSSTVARMQDFTGLGKRLDGVFARLQYVEGRNNGPANTGGPFGPQGPTINGAPVDAQVPTVITPPQESHVLSDAILEAALDLSKRDKTRRRVIFVISDGREIGSTASYRDVLKVLLSNGIAVYGLDVGGGGIPGYNKLQRLHLPRMGYGDLLPKYASATAGEVLNETSRDAIETAYSRALGAARNQYTLGYRTRVTASEAYRQIEVTVDRPSCRGSYRPCVSVYARDGYYPLPPGR